jgi:hypothetical protein
MKSKKSHTEWKALVTQFKNSGLSMSRFSRENNLKGSTFIYWVKMFSADTDKTKMIKLEPKPANTLKRTDDVKIIIGNVKLEISGILKPEKISKIISILMEVD